MSRAVVVVFAIAACGGSSATPDAAIADANAACRSQFATTQTYSIAAGASPIAIASGDFNSDTLIDLVVADAGTADVAFLPGQPGPFITFGAATRFPADAMPAALLARDLDGDGHLDLAVAAAGGNDIALLHGNADGTFQPPDDYPTGMAPRAIALGDFDSDAILDLVTANAGTVSVLRGGAGGVFGQHVDTTVDTAPLAGLVVGDFDHDGHVDLAVGLTSSAQVAVLLGHGDGTFAAPTTFATGTGTVAALGGADLDKDGNLDVVVGGAGGVVVLRGTGGGALAAVPTPVIEDNVLAIEIADYDGDDMLDIAYATTTGVAIVYGTGGTSFGAPAALATSTAPAGLAVGELDANADIDLVTANGSADSVSVFLDHGCP
ncbi:MAG TPA: VCBS repeat-containing protein [Kofleriaceae bacterium]|nr:VCBS repeat-containing protein [Kofleriaceae bacterium]